MLGRARLLSFLRQTDLRSRAGVRVLQSRDEPRPFCGAPSLAPDTSSRECPHSTASPSGERPRSCDGS